MTTSEQFNDTLGQIDPIEDAVALDEAKGMDAAISKLIDELAPPLPEQIKICLDLAEHGTDEVTCIQNFRKLVTVFEEDPKWIREEFVETVLRIASENPYKDMRRKAYNFLRDLVEEYPLFVSQTLFDATVIAAVYEKDIWGGIDAVGCARGLLQHYPRFITPELDNRLNDIEQKGEDEYMRAKQFREMFRELRSDLFPSNATIWKKVLEKKNRISRLRLPSFSSASEEIAAVEQKPVDKPPNKYVATEKMPDHMLNMLVAAESGGSPKIRSKNLCDIEGVFFENPEWLSQDYVDTILRIALFDRNPSMRLNAMHFLLQIIEEHPYFVTQSIFDDVFYAIATEPVKFVCLEAQECGDFLLREHLRFATRKLEETLLGFADAKNEPDGFAEQYYLKIHEARCSAAKSRRFSLQKALGREKQCPDDEDVRRIKESILEKFVAPCSPEMSDAAVRALDMVVNGGSAVIRWKNFYVLEHTFNYEPETVDQYFADTLARILLTSRNEGLRAAALELLQDVCMEFPEYVTDPVFEAGIIAAIADPVHLPRYNAEKFVEKVLLRDHLELAQKPVCDVLEAFALSDSPEADNATKIYDAIRLGRPDLKLRCHSGLKRIFNNSSTTAALSKKDTPTVAQIRAEVLGELIKEDDVIPCTIAETAKKTLALAEYGRSPRIRSENIYKLRQVRDSSDCDSRSLAYTLSRIGFKERNDMSRYHAYSILERVYRKEPAMLTPTMYNSVFVLGATEANGLARLEIDDIAVWLIKSHGAMANETLLDLLDEIENARDATEGFKKHVQKYREMLFSSNAQLPKARNVSKQKSSKLPLLRI